MVHKEENYNGAPEEHTDIRNVTVPLIFIFSIVGFFMWTTYIVMSEKSKLKDDIENDLGSLQNKVNEDRASIITLKERQQYVLENIWTKQDHTIWCYELQRQNPSITCPAHESTKNGKVTNEHFHVPLLAPSPKADAKK